MFPPLCVGCHLSPFRALVRLLVTLHVVCGVGLPLKFIVDLIHRWLFVPLAICVMTVLLLPCTCPGGWKVI